VNKPEFSNYKWYRQIQGFSKEQYNLLMLRRLTFLLLTFVLLAGCGPKATPFPVQIVTLSVVTDTPVLPTLSGPDIGSATPEPNATPLPTLILSTSILPTIEPSATPQLSPVLSSAVMQILAPGPMSKVLSPIRLRAYVIPGYGSKVRVELYGEDDRLIFRKLTYAYTDLFKWSYLSVDIPFETRAAAELARLQITAEDANGNTVALAATHLLLMPDGYEEITPSGILSERCVFISPVPSVTVSGGTLAVAGTYLPFNTEPLILELVADNGTIVGSQWLEVPSASGSVPLSFNAEITYSVDVQTQAYLVARQFDDRITGMMYLFSQPVILNP
jgi:hypothetical protein